MRSLFNFSTVLALLVIAPPRAGAQSWVHIKPILGAPTNVQMPAAPVYDPNTNRLIAFGGLTDNPCCTPVDDVWILSDANAVSGTSAWSRLAVIGPRPPARSGHSAVYDSASNRMIVFGGGQFGGSVYTVRFNDVWVLTNANGSGGAATWVPLSPAGPPPQQRAAHQAVYDPSSNRMIVFGGGNNGIMDVPNDVWVLTNANGLGGPPEWIQLSPAGAAPARRQGHVLTYDSRSNQMTVFGGCCGTLGDLWTLDNANGQGGTPAWRERFPVGENPGPRETYAWGYDQDTDQIVLFGGSSYTYNPYGSSFNDVWVLKNVNGAGTPAWVNALVNDATGAPPRPQNSHAVGVYDGVRKRLIAISPNTELWVFQRPLPVILVHGYASDPTAFGKMQELLTKDGYEVYSFNYSAWTSPFKDPPTTPAQDCVPFVKDTDHTVEDVAACFGRYVRQKGSPVHVIAHSEGGLVARAWMAGVVTDPPYNGEIATLATIGTPHYGQPLRNELVENLLHGSHKQAMEQQYGSAFISRLSDRWSAFQNGPVAIDSQHLLFIAGTHNDECHGSPNSLAVGAGILPCNDGLVDVISARLPEASLVRYVPYQHCQGLWWLLDVNCGSGIAESEVTGEDHKTYVILKAWLATGRPPDQAATGYTPSFLANPESQKGLVWLRFRNALNQDPVSSNGLSMTAALPSAESLFALFNESSATAFPPALRTYTITVTKPGFKPLPVTIYVRFPQLTLPEPIDLVPDTYTPLGTSIAVTPTDPVSGSNPVSLTFSSVTQGGTTTVTTASDGPAPPYGFVRGTPSVYYNINTTAFFTGNISICIDYSAVTFVLPPRLFHFEAGSWLDVTTQNDSVRKTACGAVTSLSPFALFSPSGAAPGSAYHVSYAANLDIADSFVNLTNFGTLNGNDPSGRICVNVYVFDPNEEPVSCCSCMVTPNGLNTLSARNDLIASPLTNNRPSGLVIKLLASNPIGNRCDPSSPTQANLVRGLGAWRTTVHALAGATGVTSWHTTEAPFTPSELSATELTKLTGVCTFIQTYASGFGLCNSCRPGAR